jgi:hypothetical protein
MTNVLPAGWGKQRYGALSACTLINTCRGRTQVSTLTTHWRQRKKKNKKRRIWLIHIVVAPRTYAKAAGERTPPPLQLVCHSGPHGDHITESNQIPLSSGPFTFPSYFSFVSLFSINAVWSACWWNRDAVGLLLSGRWGTNIPADLTAHERDEYHEVARLSCARVFAPWVKHVLVVVDGGG